MNEIKTRNSKTRELLITHYNTYPKLQPEDVFKFLFHGACGAEHLVSDEARALEYIRRELATLEEENVKYIDMLDGEYVRVHLSLLKLGLSAEELARIFCLSAKKEPDGISLLEEKLQVARELVQEGILPFDASEFDGKIAEWRNMGYPAIHHSDIFRREYHPAYRVVSRSYLPYLLRLCDEK
jgi:hypothetical protein